MLLECQQMGAVMGLGDLAVDQFIKLRMEENVRIGSTPEVLRLEIKYTDARRQAPNVD